MSTIIKNYWGQTFDIEELGYLFDQDIVLNSPELDRCKTSQMWYVTYCKLHYQKHGETFILQEQSPNI